MNSSTEARLREATRICVSTGQIVSYSFVVVLKRKMKKIEPKICDETFLIANKSRPNKIECSRGTPIALELIVSGNRKTNGVSFDLNKASVNEHRKVDKVERSDRKLKICSLFVWFSNWVRTKSWERGTWTVEQFEKRIESCLNEICFQSITICKSSFLKPKKNIFRVEKTLFFSTWPRKLFSSTSFANLRRSNDESNNPNRRSAFVRSRKLFPWKKSNFSGSENRNEVSSNCRKFLHFFYLISHRRRKSSTRQRQKFKSKWSNRISAFFLSKKVDPFLFLTIGLHFRFVLFFARANFQRSTNFVFEQFK